jgi:hypothetical protein
MNMEVSHSYGLVGAFYTVTAVFLEASGLLIRQICRLPSVVITVSQYLVNVQLSLMNSIGLGGLPWYIQSPLGALLAVQGIRFYTYRIWAFVKLTLLLLLRKLATVILLIAVSYIPQSWIAISKVLRLMRELLLRIQQSLSTAIAIPKT